MTVILYDYRSLRERQPTHLNVWKATHLILYICAAVFGVTNYVFIQNTKELVDDHCVLYPRKLAFAALVVVDFIPVLDTELEALAELNATSSENDYETKNVSINNNIYEIQKIEENVLTTTDNESYFLVLDTSRTLFENNMDCTYAEYMPLLSTVFAIVWITMFTMCPSGGRVRTGLTQPWRIVMPALIFGIIMMSLVTHNLIITQKGLDAFCEDFKPLTNSSRCSDIDPFIHAGWNSSWVMSSRIAFTRAASTGIWVSWTAVAALLLIRCLTAPDFVVKRVSVHLNKDPQEKIIPYLKKSQRAIMRSEQGLPNKTADNASVKSEPTLMTELVTASVEQGDSAPTSLMATPVKAHLPRDTENIEMTYSPQERYENH